MVFEIVVQSQTSVNLRLQASHHPKSHQPLPNLFMKLFVTPPSNLIEVMPFLSFIQQIKYCSKMVEYKLPIKLLAVA
jgi:hypothetical protein